MEPDMTQQDEATRRIVEQMKQVYSDEVIDHTINSRNRGDIPQADAYAKVTGPCGDTIEMWLKVNDGRIVRATFEPDGCATTVACGSMATELITGKKAIEAARISQEDILKALKGLPEANEHCALLAADTIKATVSDYLATKNAPWKKMYRTK